MQSGEPQLAAGPAETRLVLVHAGMIVFDRAGQ